MFLLLYLQLYPFSIRSVSYEVCCFEILTLLKLRQPNPSGEHPEENQRERDSFVAEE
jgi:hypothetical protein